MKILFFFFFLKKTCHVITHWTYCQIISQKKGKKILYILHIFKYTGIQKKFTIIFIFLITKDYVKRKKLLNDAFYLLKNSLRATYIVT